MLHPTAFGPSSETRWRALLKKHFCIKRVGISPIARRCFSCFWVMFIFFQCCTSTYFFISLLLKITPRLCLCRVEKTPNGNTCKLAQKKPQILTGLYVPENIYSYRADQLLSNSASLQKYLLPLVLGESVRCELCPEWDTASTQEFPPCPAVWFVPWSQKFCNFLSFLVGDGIGELFIFKYNLLWILLIFKQHPLAVIFRD